MDQESGGEAVRGSSYQWRNYKLVADPTIRRVPQKVYRYDGLYFNLPDAGFPPVGDVRDPRQRRIWTKHRDISLPVPKFKFDEYYVGSVPLKEVTFARLNDNIKEGFLADMCKKFGDIEEIEILYNPKNKKHLGLAKVVFASTRGAKDTVKNLHNTSVMGNIIHAQLDIKGQQRMKYFELIVNGFYTPQTVPTGGKALMDKFPVHQADVTNDPRRRRSCDASFPTNASQPTTPGNGTPCSQDTAYSSGHQDTPSSFGQYTPGSQGTPYTPRGGTPFSQDSSYSSRQGTPAYQTFQQDPSYKCRRHDSVGSSYPRRHAPPYLPYRPQEQQQHPYPGYPHQPFPLEAPPAFHPPPPPPRQPPTPSSSSSFPPAGDGAPYPGSYPAYAKEPAGFPYPPAPAEGRPPSPPPPSPPARPSSPPETTPAAESLPFAQHPSLDSRIEMLLKAQCAPGFSFLAADSEDEEERRGGGGGGRGEGQEEDEEGVRVGGGGEEGGGQEQGEREEGEVEVGGQAGPPPPPETRPPPLPPPPPPPPPPPAGFEDTPASSAPPPPPLPPPEGKASEKRQGEKKDPEANGEEMSSAPSSGEDMEISDDEPGDPQPAERIELPPPGGPYPPYTGPPPGAGEKAASAAAPPPPPHHHPPHPHPHPHHPHPAFPPHIYDFVNSIELMSRLGSQWGGMPMSFQMQTQMLSRLQQLARAKGPLPPGADPPPSGYQCEGGFATQAGYSLYRAPEREGRPFPEREPLPLLPTSSASSPPSSSSDCTWPTKEQKEDPHLSTVDGVLSALVQEMKNIMKRDLNRKMVEMVAFRTFDEWWERKEQKAKPFHNAARLQAKEEEKPKPKEPAMFSLVDWAKSGGVGGGAGSASGLEGYGFGMGLRASLRLPSFKVKRKELSDLPESVEQKRPRQSLPLYEEDEETEREKETSDVASHPSEAVKRETEAAKKRGKPSKSLELNSEGEEEEEASEKEEEEEEEEEEGELDASEKEDSEEDEAASDTSSKAGESEEGSEASTGFASSSEDEEEEEEMADTMDDSTMDGSVAGEKETKTPQAPAGEAAATAQSRPEEGTGRPSEGPLEPAAAAVNTEETEQSLLKAEPGSPLPEKAPSSPSPGLGPRTPEGEEEAPSSPAPEPPAPRARQRKRVSFSRSEEEEDGEEGEEDKPELPATIRNLPLDHAALVKSPTSHPGAPQRPRPRRDASEDESLRLKEQLGASSLLQLANTALSPPRPPSPCPSPSPEKGLDLAALADIALTFGEGSPPSPSSCSTSSPSSSSSSAEEPLPPSAPARPERLFHLEHSYAKPARPPSPSPRRRRVPADPPRGGASPPPELLSDLLEAPEEVVAAPPPPPTPPPPPPPPPSDPELPPPPQKARRRRREEEGGEEEEEQEEEKAPSAPKRLEPGEVPPAGRKGADGGGFRPRSEFEEMAILYEIWNSGLDPEDLHYLRLTYQRLLQEDTAINWLNDTHWVFHTITNIPSPKRKRRSEDGLREHLSGSARSEGYYKISKREKDVYLRAPVTTREALLAHPSLSTPTPQSQGTNRLLSERRSEQRRLLSAIGTSALVDSDLLKFNQLKFRKKKLRFGRSRIHEWGLFAMEPIAADEMVIEYVGQNIRQMVADMRERRYEDQGIGSSYLFRVDHDTIIDATKSGNLARFINHCCTPNCYAKVITLEAQKKIVIYSKQAISVNEEITYDYKFPIEENKIACLCGTENCRGTLN